MRVGSSKLIATRHIGQMAQRKPKYCPEGTYRCPACNSLVREGAECGCEARRAAQAEQDAKTAVKPVSTTYSWREQGKKRLKHASKRKAR